MRFDGDASADPSGTGAETRSDLDEPAAPRDRLLAPADPGGRDLVAGLQARIAELDAVAWNLPDRPHAVALDDAQPSREDG